MKRAHFLHGAACIPIAFAATSSVSDAQKDPFDPEPGRWRTFEVTTSLVLPAGGPAQAWIPVPSLVETSWMQPRSQEWKPADAKLQYAADSGRGVAMVHVQWAADSEVRRCTVTSRVSTRNRSVDLSVPRQIASLDAKDETRYLASTKFIPTDGIVKETAQQIVLGATTDREKAKRIYDWVVINSYRKPTVRGCGLGNVAFLLQTGDLGGKCADINGLAVGLARAAGLPARDLYGVRVAPSDFGYKALGANPPVVTKAQHCRAEVFLSQYGWVPMDPADVRKVMLEEPPGNLSSQDSKVVDARQTLFGAWEGNYVAFNDGRDITLPGSTNDPLPFFMYPQAEINGERLDSLDAVNFSYSITSGEV